MRWSNIHVRSFERNAELWPTLCTMLLFNIVVVVVVDVPHMCLIKLFNSLFLHTNTSRIETGVSFSLYSVHPSDGGASVIAIF
mmetsp:Transcript_83012/g.115347  ORF Transcript_83012/g.115347 Transcript_83012/m.115347 type:complete len:83 (+) Transcript_83012:3-251(+)